MVVCYVQTLKDLAQKYKLASLSPVQALRAPCQCAKVISGDFSEQILKTFIVFWILSVFFPPKGFSSALFLRWF